MASQAENTAVCVVDWSTRPGRIVRLECGLGDDDAVDILRTETRIGVDIPLGWPSEFVESVASWATGTNWLSHADGDERLRLRSTDIWLKRKLREGKGRKITPLSVAADRIAIPAMRMARLLTTAGLAAMPRDGSRHVIEVYPAAALECWSISTKGYKADDAAECRKAIVSALQLKLKSAIQIGESEKVALIGNCDQLDAFVAALVARAHDVHQTETLPREFADLAEVEGWIVLPKPNALELLAPDRL